MWHFHCSHGVGDTYLVAALTRAFEAQVGELTLTVKPEHEHIAQMFMVRAKASRVLMEAPGEHAWRPGIPINMHPSHAARGDAIDMLTGREGVSQADMYRVLMRLPLDAALSKPLLLNDWKRQAKGWADQHKIEAGSAVVVMPHARSLPAAPFEFWIDLALELATAGKTVIFNSVEPWPPHLPAAVTMRLDDMLKRGRLVRAFPQLGVLYALIEHAGWVIGPNTGGFVAAVAAELSACKTLVAFDAGEGKPWRFNPTIELKGAFPFSHQRKFCGRDYEVDEHLVDRNRSTQARVISDILGSAYFRHPNACHTKPMVTLRAPVSVGQVVDRITILEMKIASVDDRRSLMALRREMIELEGVLREAGISLDDQRIQPHVLDLRKANSAGFYQGETMYGMTVRGTAATPDALKLHIETMQSNRDRTRAIQNLNAAIGSLLTEVKTYKLD